MHIVPYTLVIETEKWNLTSKFHVAALWATDLLLSTCRYVDLTNSHG